MFRVYPPEILLANVSRKVRITMHALVFGVHKPRRFVIKCKPMLFCVPCRFGYQFISILSSILLLIYLCLPNKLYYYY